PPPAPFPRPLEVKADVSLTSLDVRFVPLADFHREISRANVTIAYHPSNTFDLSALRLRSAVPAFGLSDQAAMRHIRQLGPVAYRMALCCGLDQSPDPCRACAAWRGFRPPYQRLPSLALFAATLERQWRDWECPTPPLIILGAAFNGGFQ